MTESEKRKYLKSKGCDIDLALGFLEDFENYDATMQDFADEIYEKIENLKELFDLEKIDDYAIAVHALKSNAKYIGFSKLVNIAYEHELAAKKGDIKFVKENFDKLLDEADKTIDIVEEYLEKIEG